MSHFKLILLPCAFLGYTLLLYVYLTHLKELPLFNSTIKNERLFKLPKSKEEVKRLADNLIHYQKKYPNHVLCLFCALYVYKQTFAIPGSFFLNLLAGALYTLSFSFPLVCVLTASGATSCYLLSRWFGKPLVDLYISEYFIRFNKMVNENKNRLFFFLVSLRLFPMSPNWLINILCPLVGISCHVFFITTFIGLGPYNFLTVHAGTMLSKVSIEESPIQNVLLLGGASAVVILPVIILPRLRGWFAKNTK